MTQERKYILIGGAILLLLGVFYRFTPDINLDTLYSLSNEIALKEKQVAKYRQMVANRSEIEKQLVSLNRNLERAEAGLLTGETPALAAVDIQNTLNEITERSKAEIKSMRVLKPEELDKESPVKDYYVGIPVEITLNANIRQLKEVLYRIETSPKLLNIVDMRIRLNNTRQVETVYAILTVSGFMKKTKG